MPGRLRTVSGGGVCSGCGGVCGGCGGGCNVF